MGAHKNFQGEAQWGIAGVWDPLSDALPGVSHSSSLALLHANLKLYCSKLESNSPKVELTEMPALWLLFNREESEFGGI